MKVCENTGPQPQTRLLKYSDLKPGDIFRWVHQQPPRAPYMMKDTDGGHIYLTSRDKRDIGRRYTSSHLIDADRAIIRYPDACLDPGEGILEEVV